MLDKTNYTTRTDLSPEELRALVNVRTKLETGEIATFDMALTTCCIGGYMARELGKSSQWVYQAYYGDTKFNKLFFPVNKNGSCDWQDLQKRTIAGGIAAITNFLNGSNTPWE